MRDGSGDQPQAGQHERDVQDEDGPPGDRVDEEAAQRRAEGDRPARPGRPRPDRCATLGALERRGDDRERAGDQQRPGHPLQSPEADQHARVRRDRAQEGSDAEPGHPGREHPPPTDEVAQRATDQHERPERQEVGLDDPLLLGEVGAEVVAEPR